MTKEPIKIFKQIMGLLAVILLLIIFKDVVFSVVDKLIVPITSKVEPNTPVVLICAILLVISTYLANGLLIKRKNYIELPCHILTVVAITIIFYSLFRFSGHYEFYGVGKVTYVDTAFVTAAILEILSFFVPYNRNRIGKADANVNVNVNGFVSDNPTKTDKLGRLEYAELLLDKICETYKSGQLEDGSMTILLNERYGAGKTTFFNMLEDKAKGRIKTCVFKPWQTADGERMTEELLRLLEEQYSISNQLSKQLKAYSQLLAGSEINNVLDFFSLRFKDRNSLAQRYDAIKDTLLVINEPLVVLVDDVDRLQAEELLALLKLLRDTVDFPNIIYLVAADKEAMSQMLETKGIKDADEYLKKFFNFELLFPIDDSFLKSLLREEVVKTLTSYYGASFSMPLVEKGFLSASYIKYVFSSPRDVYRYINLLTYYLDLFARYGILEEVYIPDLLKLLLIQFISPMVYKILRDEMDLLLNVRGNDGRIHLKNGYKNIIVSRQLKKQMQDMTQAIVRNGSKQTGSEDNEKEGEELTLFDIPAKDRPNKEDIVSELLRDLFYDTQNYQNKKRICYLGEYFKFFAGKYSKDELSSQYMKSLMGLSSDKEFEEKMGKVIQQGKAEFLIHKLKLYVEEEEWISKDIPGVLMRCITINDAVYRDWAQNRGHYSSPKDYNEIGQFGPVYSNLLLVEKKHIITDEAEIEKVKKLYAVNKQYTWLASALNLPVIGYHDMAFVYGPNLHLELRESLIRRFILEELSEKPFEKEKIEVIPILHDLYSVYWEEHFKEYVKNCAEPKAWLYILFRPAGELLEWNYPIYKNLVGGGLLDSYAKETLGLELPREIIEDLTEISGMHNEAALTATNFGHHPFLIDAKKWWDAKGKK